MERDDYLALKEALREILVEEGVWQSPPIATRFRDGTLEFRPKNAELKTREIPIETFFKKVVAVREKLRMLEQKINNHPHIDEASRMELAQYLTRAYGSLTTFNFLFQDKDDHFVGEGRRTSGD
jgi:hypothetical protein